MNRFLSRLARASASELRFRGRESAWLAAEAISSRTGGARWRRAQLRGRLLSPSSDLEPANAALRRRDWRRAGAEIRSHFVHRAPRFVIDPGGRAQFARRLGGNFPDAADEATYRADRLLAGQYDLLGYRDLSFGSDGKIDWHLDPVHGRRSPSTFWARVPYLDAGVGDHKIIWELNRHQHWMALGRAAWLTGDGRYISAVARELESWLNANPPLTGINWSSMLELGFRCISWIWALHLCAPFDEPDDPAWFVDLLVGLDRQLDHIARHLSVYFSPNTHLLGEALALYVGGRVLPELRSAARWERIGRDILVREAAAQVHADGGHVELSAHYHRYALDFYLLALSVARRTSDPAADVFGEVASRLATFCRALADDNGQLPAIGDDDGGLLFPICGRSASDASDSLALAGALLRRPDLPVSAASEEVFWMAGGDESALPTAAGARPASRLFRETGYAVLRSPAGQAIVDAGHHGFLNAGHAHADALSVVLSVDGRPLLIDPGTATYTMDASVRNRFRSTAMHNTVAIDDKPQSVPAGPFHWASWADARVDLWRTMAELDCLEALHEGYAPLIHRRCVLRVDDALWLIGDHLLATGRYEAATYWHFHPAWMLAEPLADEIRLEHPDGYFASLASTTTDVKRFRGDVEGLGWYAPVYGRVVPSTTLRFSISTDTPISLITAIGWNTAPVRLLVDRAEISAERQDGWHRAAATITLGKSGVVALFAAPRSERAGNRSVHVVSAPQGQLLTDARIAVLRLSASGDPVAISVVGGRSVEWRGRAAFNASLADGEPVDAYLDEATLGLHRHVASGTPIEIDRAGTTPPTTLHEVGWVG